MRTKILTKLKRFQQPLERYLFPVLLLLWPLVTADQGVDITDTTYSLGNFRYLGTGNGVGSTWFFATFLANELGKLLSALPGGNTLLGMNIYTGLLISAAALTVYFVMRRMFPGWMLFFAEFLAESFCWCPSVILYNTLSYLLLTLACVFLFLAVSAVEEKSGRKWYVFAGVCIGLNVCVRLSNLTQAALIPAVWFASALDRADRAKFVTALRRTLFCIAGALLGFLAGWMLSAVQYGPAAWFRMIPQLFSMTSSAQDYTAGGMLADILAAYGTSLRWFLILVPCVLAGFLLFHLPLIRRRPWIGRLIYSAGILVLIRFYLARGMFNLVFTDYWSMFQWGMFFLLLSIILDVCAITGGLRGTNTDERFLGALSLLLILILPVGSNNYTFPVIGCLFFIAPVTLWFLRRGWQETRKSIAQFSWHSMALMILVMALGTGALFHLQFAFGDGTDGTPRMAQTDIPYLADMRTTEQNAQQLGALYHAVQNGGYGDRTLLTYGDAPGLSILLDMEPAISTTWPDLASCPEEEFREELGKLTKKSALPVVILHHLTTAGQGTPEKAELVQEFLQENGYEAVFEEEEYTLYAVGH